MSNMIKHFMYVKELFRVCIYFSRNAHKTLISRQRKQNVTTWGTSEHSSQAHTPQRTRDDTTGDAYGRNLPIHGRNFNELESSLCILEKQSETLQPGHRKTLRLSSRSVPPPAQRNISLIVM